MREIKFRAYDKQFKKMFVVESIDFQSGTVVGGGGIYPCDSIELMQFTGLKDKNGKEIYEGDILEQAVPLSDRYIGKGPVEFSKGCFIIKAISTEEHQIVSDWIRIIGNIYENKSLLKEEV